MKKHLSQLFLYDEEKTRLGYSELDYKFSDSIIKTICIEKVTRAMERNSIDIGVDFQKPWEELLLDDNHFQIEYLFVGKLRNKSEFINDPEIGINFFEENRFGKDIFDSKEVLKLILIIEKI
ncbi:hypothetical protein [Flammeovirga kamogawensis]|uniref:Uncharacterized protein n=1 Tax=Flammeovirga kamogawensis TaxID=373891 RepID=A0ABX8H4X1_9BACT|nr:hypothetical protein [Flammeovirga kamogawensis]MBB6461979.1 hypothetical protein [Flammeovirga kamogawensis]QWG10417.1 hypothetical protein KM029_25920 [Flammeovirga kamogawensis]TRX63927.1 hypothetical protein EO216_26295 [Flammeovirga kamogawensis]